MAGGARGFDSGFASTVSVCDKLSWRRGGTERVVDVRDRCVTALSCFLATLARGRVGCVFSTVFSP